MHDITKKRATARLTPVKVFFAALLLAACSGDESPDPTGGAGGSSTLGEACDESAECGSAELCQPQGYTCGDDSFGSVCAERPTDCSGATPLPVCGCDGEIYDSLCAAEAAGVGAALYSNVCTAPTDTKPCGWTFCGDEEACVENLEVSFECRALPAGCDPDAPTCDDCVPDGLEDCSCSDAGGGIAITCGV